MSVNFIKYGRDRYPWLDKKLASLSILSMSRACLCSICSYHSVLRASSFNSATCLSFKFFSGKLEMVKWSCARIHATELDIWRIIFCFVARSLGPLWESCLQASVFQTSLSFLYNKASCSKDESAMRLAVSVAFHSGLLYLVFVIKRFSSLSLLKHLAQKL